MKTFYNWLKIKENAGGDAIVGCKDRSNANFQIWGALSDLNCGKKSIKKKKNASLKKN